MATCWDVLDQGETANQFQQSQGAEAVVGASGAIAMAAFDGAAGGAVEYLTPAEIIMMIRDNEALFMQQIKVPPPCYASACGDHR